MQWLCWGVFRSIIVIATYILPIIMCTVTAACFICILYYAFCHCPYFYRATVPLKCNFVLARQYFPRISILGVLLSTSTHINSTRVKADVEDSVG